MEANDQSKKKNGSPGSESHGVHICNKCGWQYLNPHPSAKQRRAHKKICGSDDHNSLSPKLVEEVKNGVDRSKLEVFEDVASEYSGIDQAIMETEKITKNTNEIQQTNNSSTSCQMHNSEVSDSSKVLCGKVFGTQKPVRISVEIDTFKHQVLNDDVIHSAVEGPDEFALENSVIIGFTEDQSVESDNLLVDTCAAIANAAQKIAPAESSTDLSHVHVKTKDRYEVDSAGHENELIEANGEDKGDNITTINEKNDLECSRETYKASLPLNDAELCVRNNEDQSRGIAKEFIPVEITNPQEDVITRFGSTVTAFDAVKTSDQRLLRSEIKDLDILEANQRKEIDDNTEEYFVEIPARTIESNGDRDVGKLQNLSEADINDLVPCLVTTCNASEAKPEKYEENESSFKSENNKSEGDDIAIHSSNTRGSVSGVEREIKKQDILLQPSSNDSTSEKEQHMPLKNLLSKAISPEPQAVDNKNNGSSILATETSPDSCFPAKGEELKTPPETYPVDVNGEKRKVKKRPFWVPFICCSTAK